MYLLSSVSTNSLYLFTMCCVINLRHTFIHSFIHFIYLCEGCEYTCPGTCAAVRGWHPVPSLYIFAFETEPLPEPEGHQYISVVYSVSSRHLPVFSSLALTLEGPAPMLGLCGGGGDLNAGLHTFVANTLPT